jgi:hypothetical protein
MAETSDRGVQQTCCGEELAWCLGSASKSNVTVELLRCRCCEDVHSYVSAPTWISAVARCVARLEREVAERAYAHRDAP